MRRFAWALLLVAAAVAPAWADPLPEHAAGVVAYAITVSLDPATHQLKATERLTWTNPSQESVGELWFHLYLNAFKNTRTTFFKESGGQLRGDRMQPDSWGWIDVSSIRTAGGAELVKQLVFERPDDGNAADQTVARLPLPEAVPPGGSVTLDVAFTAQLPKVFARTGYTRSFYLVGQWFPKLGVYEPAGMRGRRTAGWNCHQFHATSEFYADFGTYHVAITTPSNFVVGATGVRTAERRNTDGTTTVTYDQADVHDFAWTADSNYTVVKATFSATRDVTEGEYAASAARLGRTIDDMRLRDVEITVLMQPEHMAQAQRHVDAAKAGLKWFGLWYGRYPYPTLTVVDPAYGAGGAGGMEYPTFITAGTSVLFNRWPLSGVRGTEEVTIHEFGHQFWYAMVANNEFEEAWLDEGINSYSTGRVMERVYGSAATMVDVLGLRIGERDVLRLSNSPLDLFNRVASRAWEYTPLDAYSFYAYRKPELVLRTLENHVGTKVMARVMRTFQERWRFKHPATQDFIAIVNEITGRDLGWLFDQAFNGTDVLDYDLGEVSSTPVHEARGVVDDANGRRTISDDDAAKLEREAATAKKTTYLSTVVVRRRGGVWFPVEVAFKFEGQPVERATWDGRDRTKTFTFTRPQRLEWVDIDPDRKVELDVNWLNNGRRLEPDSRPAAGWALRWFWMVQNVVAALGLM